jgi:glycosyltransferase involved in cell wall biosynthesis
MKIAMIGQKGVPATFGGIERHVEELGARLAVRGHDVTVFTRPNYTDRALREYRGMKLVSLPSVGTKHLDAITHSAEASLAVWGGGYDIVHYHAIGPCLASPLAWARGRRIVATIHGVDWRRGKWSPLASGTLRLGEALALRIPNATICVSRVLAREYEARGHEVEYIPNGVSIESGDDTSVLDQYGLSDGQYVLFAGRLVPEKGAHYLIEAHKASGSGMPLVIAGDTSMSGEYVARLRAQSGRSVVFVGYQYGAQLASLFRHAALFVLPSDLEGLPIVLLEAIAYGAPVLASDIGPNVEVLGDEGAYFRAGDVANLAERLIDALGSVEAERSHAVALRDAALVEYDWDRVADATVALYGRVLGR